VKEAEAKLLFGAGVVESVVIFERRPDAGYEVWLHGEAIPTHVKQRLEIARGGLRVFATVDSAWRRVRELGWRGSVTVERPA